MANDRTEDTLLNKLIGVTIFDKPSSEVIGPSKVKEPMGQKTSVYQQKEMSGSSQLKGVKISDDPSSKMAGPSKVKEPMGLKAPQKEMSGSSQVKEQRGIKTSVHSQKGMSLSSQLDKRMTNTELSCGSSEVKELTERKLRRNSTIKFKFPRELNNVLPYTRRLHLTDRYSGHWCDLPSLQLKQNRTEFSVVRYGKEVRRSMSWTIDGDETCLEFEDIVSPELNEVISALVPLCQVVQHITIDCHELDLYIPAHDTRPFIPMRSVLTVCISYIKSRSPDAPILSTLSDCFPNAKSLELSCHSRDFTHTRKYHSDPPLSSWRQVKLDLRNGHSRDFVTLETIFLSLSSACQNIESLFIKSRKAFQWGKSSTTIKAYKLPFLTSIHLKSRWREEHYTLQLIKDLLYDVNPGLKFVKVESVQLGNVVLESVKWSRTSSDCGLQIKGASAAVPITELIDLTTSDLKDVTVLTLVSCKIDFGQSESKSPKELGTLREIRFVGSENPLSESDRNKLSELYPNVKVTENQTSQESFVESQEGAGIPSKLDKASSQSLKTSAIDELAEEKVEFHEDTGSQNPVGGEEETSWQEKEEEFDVKHGSLTNESGSVGVVIRK